MKVTVTNTSDTKADITVVASEEDLKEAQQRALKRIQPNVSADGFRKGKVPLNMVEKHVDPKTINTEALDEAVNTLLIAAIQQEKLRVLDKPTVEVTKYVPGQELEFTAGLEVMAPVKLADYKKLKKKPISVTVTDEDIDKVLDNLRLRVAEKQEVDREAKDGDEVWIDFEGTDTEGKEVPGAKGSDYPLRLGSDTFIPGFEKNLLGAKKGDEKEFTLTFPKDYGHQPLAGQKVTFKVKVRIVKEVVLPKVDDDFAGKVGPFKSADELKEDVKQQLTQQKTNEAMADLQDEIVSELLEKSTLTPPESFVQDQQKHILEDFKQNLAYRGITIAEYLKQAGQTEEEYVKQEVLPQAERRVKIGILLSEIAGDEKIDASEEEITRHIQLAQGQMQSQPGMLDPNNPDLRRDVANRLITQKTLEKLVEYATN